MEEKKYKYISAGLAVLCIILVVLLFLKPKGDIAALRQDLAQFTTTLQQWNAQYGNNPTPEGKAKLSDDLSAFSNKLQTYQQ